MAHDICLIGATYSGNKGAAGMLVACTEALRRKLGEDSRFSVLSIYSRRDSAHMQKDVAIVPLSPPALILLFLPISFLYFLLSWSRLLRRPLLFYKPLHAIVKADVLLDLSGISFVDGRTATLVYNVACILPAILVGTPVVKMSQALGPFNNRLNRMMASTLLPRMKMIFSRGSITSEFLKNLGLKNWLPAGDLAFLLDSGAALPKAEETVFGIIPSEVMRRYCGKRNLDYVSILADTLKQLISDVRPCRIKIISHSNLGPESESRNNDFHVCKALCEQLSSDNADLIIEDLGPKELRRIIGNCDIVISSRFHGMISALCTTTPVIATAWSHKYVEVMRSFGCERWVVGFRDMDSNHLYGITLEALNSREEISKQIARRLPLATESAAGQISAVVELLRQNATLRQSGIGKTARRLYSRFYAGSFKAAAIGHASEPEIREASASGGLVTTLLIERMKKGVSDGAIVADLKTGKGLPTPRTFLARSTQELIRCGGSIYTDFNHFAGIKKILRENEGVFDVVGLPCQLSALKSLSERDSELQSRIGLLVGLWCGHATDSPLLKDLLRKWHIEPEEIEEFKYRQGHWRGETFIRLKNGKIVRRSFKKQYGLYQNLYVDCMPRCFSCPDHFAESADISFGDCWLPSEKRRPVKRTMALALTKTGLGELNRLTVSDACNVTQCPPELAVEAQKRAVIWHTFSCAARARIGRTFGVGVRSGIDITPRINDYVSAAMILSGYRLFNGPLRSLLFRLPWWLLYPAMAVQKLMLNR